MFVFFDVNIVNNLSPSPHGSPQEAHSPLKFKARYLEFSQCVEILYLMHLYSSTSTLFISDTITKPDVEDILRWYV